MQDNIIKIDLTNMENARNWNTFVEKCFNATINRNEDGAIKHSKYLYTFTYAPDEVTITNHEVINDIPFELKSITLGIDEYNQGNKSDKDIIEGLFNSVEPSR